MVGEDEDFNHNADEFGDFGNDLEFGGNDWMDGNMRPGGRVGDHGGARPGVMGMPGRGRPDMGDIPSGMGLGMGYGRRGMGGTMGGRIHDFDPMLLGRTGGRRGPGGLAGRRQRRPPRTGARMMGKGAPPDNEFDEPPFLMSGGRAPGDGDGSWDDPNMEDDCEYRRICRNQPCFN